MAANFVIWEASFDPARNFCSLDELDNVEDTFELERGVPRADGFPDDAVYYMDPDFPKKVELADNVFNTDQLIVASKPLKEFVESRDPRNMEYLPVTILNHKERVASKDYFIIHPIRPPECLDIEKSGARWDKLTGDEIDRIKKLVIDESRIDAGTLILRMKYFNDVVLIRRDLAEAISAEGFSGIRWIELDKYPED